MRRILVAADDAVQRDYLLCILEPFGSCETAGDGQEALERFHHAAGEGRPYDVVVLDVTQAEGDGFAAAAAMMDAQRRAGIPRESRSCVVVVTAAEDPGAREDRDVDAVLLKPVTRRQVLETLANLGLVR